MRNKKIYQILPAILVFTVSIVSAQKKDTTLTREVEVVKPFTPELMDVHKINDIPKIKDTEPKKPVFNYSIDSKPVENIFAVTPLKAATIESEPETQKGYGFLKAGLGNYNRPYGEFFFNHLTSQKSIFGLHAKHISSAGTIKLEGGDKVDAPFSNNEAEVYFNQFFREKVLAVNVGYDRDAFNYYGYPKEPVPDILLAENQKINYFGTKQAFSKAGINVRLNNPSATMKDQLLGFDFVYHYFETKSGQNENHFDLAAHLQQPVNFGTFMLDASASYNKATEIIGRLTEMPDNRQQSWLFMNPSIYFARKMLTVDAGINFWYVTDKDVNAQLRMTPNVLLNFTPVKNKFKMYVGIDGKYVDNRYSKIAYENPFVDPYHDIYNSFEKIRFYGGFDGKIAPGTKLKIGFDYSITDDQPFYYQVKNYYLDTLTMTEPTQIVNNEFLVLYDDLNRFKLNVEFFHTSAGKLNISLNANYYAYELDEQEEAWNLPKWDAKLSAGYKITERLGLTTDFYLMGSRKALIVENPNPYIYYFVAPEPVYLTYELKPVFDLNIRGNYQITDRFSAFAQLNNFGFQKYERWFGYPVQSFNFLAGVSYAF